MSDSIFDSIAGRNFSLIAEIERLRADKRRLDYLETEMDHELEPGAPHSLFRRNQPITREAIDEILKFHPRPKLGHIVPLDDFSLTGTDIGLMRESDPYQEGCRDGRAETTEEPGVLIEHRLEKLAAEWEVLGPGSDQTLEASLAREAAETLRWYTRERDSLIAENKRLRGEYRSLVGLITHREHGNCPDACTACDAIKELRRIMHKDSLPPGKY